MFNLTKKHKPLVGVDISSTAVKLLELSQKGDGYHVEAYAVAPLPADAVQEKAIIDPDAVGQAVSKALERSGSKAKHAALAVSGSSVITKIIQMPADLRPMELETQIQLEADQYIPYPLEEINLDFQVIGPNQAHNTMIDVLLAATKSENIDFRVAAIEMAGLNAKVVDIEPYTYAHAFPLLNNINATEGQTTVIFDAGATLSSLNVFKDLKLVYTREQALGGKQLTEEIMRRYGLSFEDAGRAKRDGGLPDGYITDVLQPFMHTMTQQINRFLQFYYSASNSDHIDQLIIAGGCAAIANVDQYVQSQLGIPTSIANPFSDITIAPRVNQQRLFQDSTAMMIACGLAMRGFDHD